MYEFIKKSYMKRVVFDKGWCGKGVCETWCMREMCVVGGMEYKKGLGC